MPETKYENLRDNINPRLGRASDAQIEALLNARGISPEMAEGFLDGIGKALLPALPSILPIAGTVLGGAFGGPIGASLGGSLGQLAGGAIGGATAPPARPAPAPPRAAPPPPVAPSPAPPAVFAPPAQPLIASAPSASRAAPPMPSGGVLPPTGGGSPAAAQLLQTVTRPETLRALMSMIMGPIGNVNVDVGDTPVPVGAFANLLGVLADRASSEYAQAAAGAPGKGPAYMLDYAGELTGDPAVASHRAEALYELLERESLRPPRSMDAGGAGEAAEAAEAAEAEAEAAEAEAESEAWELLEFIEGFEAE